jgi:hypothetical protein
VGGGSAEALAMFDAANGDRNQLDYISSGAAALDLSFSGDNGYRFDNGGGTSGLRLLTSSTNARIEAGTTAQGNMSLVLSGNRDATGTLLTSKFSSTALTGTITVAGGSPAAGSVLISQNANGLAAWTGAGTTAQVLIGGTPPSFSSTLPAVALMTWPYVAKAANYTITNADGIVNYTSGTFTLTLPTAFGVTGRMYVIKNSGSGVITVDGAGTETIDGGLTAVLRRQYESITIYSDGENWGIM